MNRLQTRPTWGVSRSRDSSVMEEQGRTVVLWAISDLCSWDHCRRPFSGGCEFFHSLFMRVRRVHTLAVFFGGCASRYCVDPASLSHAILYLPHPKEVEFFRCPIAPSWLNHLALFWQRKLGHKPVHGPNKPHPSPSKSAHDLNELLPSSPGRGCLRIKFQLLTVSPTAST